MTVRPLIEQWFPAEAVGAESVRELESVRTMPKMRMLHVWWARRPLIASRAAIAASLLPAWPSEVEAEGDPQAAEALKALQDEFGDESRYHEWFLRLMAIEGDPVSSREKIRRARAAGIRFAEEAYGYPRAFTVTPSDDELRRLHKVSALKGGGSESAVLDPFAGGGSIPYETLRLGFSAIANELNPVAGAVLAATLDYSRDYGPALADHMRRWGRVWASKVEKSLEQFFPIAAEGVATDYVWAHTVPCPSTGRPTPLCPDFWLLRTDGRQVAVELKPDSEAGTIDVKVVEGKQAAAIAADGTYKRGVGRCIWCADETFDGDYIRRQATSGSLGQMLLTVVHERPGRAGRGFRAPSAADLEAIAAAEAALAANEARWQASDLIPSEDVQPGEKTNEPRRMGLVRWRDMFSPRQLLANVTILEAMQEALAEAAEVESKDVVDALNLYFALAFDKCVDYNGRLSSWDATRNKVRNTFDRHDFAFKWSFAEFEAAHGLVTWTLEMLLTNYDEVARHLYRPETLGETWSGGRLNLLQGSATSLPIDDRSIAAVVMDPPYYDNVIYSECSDYFYVWLKRSLRARFPQLTSLLLTDKDREAVANASRFVDLAPVRRRTRTSVGPTAGDMADRRYGDLMREAFAECHRVLRDDGVMTVMFTHKRVDAWDSLGGALLAAGFTIESSWPVHTESQHSLHQARKNAASSTILLTCRKRGQTEPAWWEDVRPAVARAARESAAAFGAAGMHGVDLTLSTFGPTLAVLSEHWPVYSGQVDPATGESEVLRPDVALDLARTEVARLKKRGLVGGKDVQFDAVSDFYLIAWSDFRAAEFPAGEALKLAIASGLELDDLIRRYRILGSTSGFVELLSPARRRANGSLDINSFSLPHLVDSLHALMLIFDEDGEPSARAFVQGRGLDSDQRFRDLMMAVLNAIPRIRDQSGFVVPEAGTLEAIRVTLFPDIEAPAIADDVQPQLALDLGSSADEEAILT